MPAITMESGQMERKILSISPKRQITIPHKFYKQLGLETEVECFVQNGALVIRPIRNKENELSIEILKDLVTQGYSGEELIRRFEYEHKVIRKAVGIMLDEAELIASGEISAASFEDIFGTED